MMGRDVTSKGSEIAGARFYVAVAAISAGTALTVLDGSIANLALPSIAQALHASTAASIWIVNAYQLTIVMSLLPLAALGEIIGYRKVFQGGLALFTIASVLCASAESLRTLALDRALQGFGAAAVMSVGSALVRAIYPANHLGRGIGINSMVVAGSMAIGPGVAGAILSIGSWPWLFAINAPIGVAAVAIAVWSLPADAGQPRAFDGISALLNALTFGLFIGGVAILSHGGVAFMSGGALFLAFGFGVALLMRQSTQTVPMLPVDLLVRPAFSLGIGFSVISFISQMIALVALPFFLHAQLGLSPAMTGLMMMPWPMSVVVTAPLAGSLADRVRPEVLGLIGLLAASGGLAALSVLTPDTGHFAIVVRVAICGIGFALFTSPNMRAIIAASPRQRSGAASGMIGMARTLGQSLGAVLAALVFGTRYPHQAVSALRLAACVAVVAAAMSLLRLLWGFAVARSAAPAEAPVREIDRTGAGIFEDIRPCTGPAA